MTVQAVFVIMLNQSHVSCRLSAEACVRIQLSPSKVEAQDTENSRMVLLPQCSFFIVVLLKQNVMKEF